MPTVAAQLRAGREAKSLTIEQVADQTKIRTDHVRALEEGRYSAFSATIYIRGSVKIYSGFLKLDTQALLATLDGELKATDKFSEPPPLTDSKKTFVDTLALGFAKLNWKVGFAGIIIIAMVFIVIVSVWVAKHRKTSDPLKNMPPAVYHPGNAGDTLPLPKH